MNFEIYPTTAELIISVSEVVYLYDNGIEIDTIEDFLDINTNTAENALKMATQLEIIKYDNTLNKYFNYNKFTKYFSSSNQYQKAAFFRLYLEDYKPFVLFKQRLIITGQAEKAAAQVKSYFNITCHREDLKNTFINLGQYTQSIESEGAGLYKVKNYDSKVYEKIGLIDKNISEVEDAKSYIYKSLGDEILRFINNTNIIDNIASSIITLNEEVENYSATIVNTANAIESFLTLIANKETIDIRNANGINAKEEKLFHGRKINNKHFNITKYLGHIRNASDHGTDSDISAEWKITKETAISYISVSLSFMKNYYFTFKNKYSL